MFDIKKQFLWSKLKVGVVITIALSILLLTIFFAGSIEKIFSSKVELKAQIQNVKGLRKGAPVWVSGIEVGSVESIDLQRGYGTIVTLSINKKALEFLRKDSEASVMTMGLLGDKYIELSTGSSEEEPIKPGDMIKGTAAIELKDVMEASASSIQKMADFIHKLDNLVTKIERGEGTITKFLTDPGIYNNLKETTKTLSAILKDIENGQGTVKMLLQDPSLYNKLVATTSSLEELSRKINEGSGTLHKLIEDPSLYNRMLSAASSVEEFSIVLNQREGTLRRLAEDPELYENLNKASQQLSSILEKIEAGEGIAGDLISDKKLSGDLKGTITEIKELTKDMKDNPKKYFKFSLF
jgi:phospholipid/cholesterol/gamma-HCH transport system substrate-binding protein